MNFPKKIKSWEKHCHIMFIKKWQKTTFISQVREESGARKLAINPIKASVSI